MLNLDTHLLYYFLVSLTKVTIPCLGYAKTYLFKMLSLLQEPMTATTRVVPFCWFFTAMTKGMSLKFLLPLPLFACVNYYVKKEYLVEIHGE